MVDFDYIATVPNTMHKGLREYIDRGIPVGGFLYHVLCNNLSDAVLVATDEELKSLRALVMSPKRFEFFVGSYEHCIR